MTWFVASIISVIKVLSAEQSEFPIYEDFYLIEAKSKTELNSKIKNIMDIIDQSGECNLEGVSARQTCVGVRKIRSIYNSGTDIDQCPPTDGTELTHSFLIASSIEEVKAYADGHSVLLRCIDDSKE